MGVGFLNPKASVACTSLASKPSPSNVVIYCIKFAQRYDFSPVLPRDSCHPVSHTPKLCKSPCQSQLHSPSARDPTPYLMILLILFALSINSCKYS
jgi:hypothetical protein